MKKIALSLATIAAMLTMTVAATGAYFSDSKVVSGNTFTTGTVRIDQSLQAPITITGLYPGADKTSDIFPVTYNGNINGDLYFGFKHVSGGAVLGDVLYFQVEKINPDGSSAGYVYTNWVQADYPYGNWTKVASGLTQGQTAYYKIHVMMADTGVAQNNLQGQTALADIVLYAVQQGGNAPTTAPINFTN